MREILLLITLISILLIGFGTVYQSTPTKTIGTLFLILVIVFGWILCAFVPCDNKITKEIATYQKFENEIKVNIKEKSFIFEKKVDFDNISDTTTFYRKLYKNVYYFTTDDKAFYLFKNKKFYSK